MAETVEMTYWRTRADAVESQVKALREALNEIVISFESTKGLKKIARAALAQEGM